MQEGERIRRTAKKSRRGGHRQYSLITPTLIVLIIIIASGGSKGPDFKSLYNEYCSSTWAEVGSDGSYLSIDTNPQNWDDDGLAYPAAYEAVKDVIAALELPDSLIKDMGKTSGADGKQEQTFPDQNVTVTWKYHPDKGLEVTFRLISPGNII